MDYKNILSKIKAKKMDEEFILPNYEEFSIVNLSNTILYHFDLQTFHEPIHIDELVGFDIHERKKFVLLIVDALGYHSFKKLLKRRKFKYIGDLFFPITSVFPSTTSTALVSFATARTPIEHGILGYILFLKEHGIIMNMIEFSPPGMGRDILLRRIDPTKFLEKPTIHCILEEKGVKSFSISASIFKNTGFNRMLNNRARIIPHHGLGDMMITLKRILMEVSDRIVISAYWSLTDTVSHRKGPNSEEYEAETFYLLNAFETEVLEKLPRCVLKDCIFVITSDHGQIETPQSSEIWLRKEDDVLKELLIPPTGEQRMMYLHTKDLEKTMEKFYDNYPDCMELIPSLKAIDMGLFGKGDEYVYSKSRIGDLVLIAKKDYSFNYIYTGQEKSLSGRHGSLTEREILVPMIIITLD